MNRQLVKTAQRLWTVPNVPEQIQRANKRKWIKSVQMLGSKWLLANPVKRHANAA